jgi:hypothetical protein
LRFVEGDGKTVPKKAQMASTRLDFNDTGKARRIKGRIQTARKLTPPSVAMIHLRRKRRQGAEEASRRA